MTWMREKSRENRGGLLYIGCPKDLLWGSHAQAQWVRRYGGCRWENHPLLLHAQECENRRYKSCPKKAVWAIGCCMVTYQQLHRDKAEKAQRLYRVHMYVNLASTEPKRNVKFTRLCGKFCNNWHGVAALLDSIIMWCKRVRRYETQVTR